MINKPADAQTIRFLEDKAYKIRKDLLNFTYQVGLGHLGGELSMADVAVALYYRYLNFDVMAPHKPDRDRFLLSKGHCCEVLYMIFSDLGAYSMDYIVEHFEVLDKSEFGMHSNRIHVPQIEISAGSLGHGLPIAVGMALGARKQKANWRTFVMTGDGELDEGSNWEAIMCAGHHQLGNLTLIVDKNRFQMTGNTEEVIGLGDLEAKLRAFGWDVVQMQGNDMADICATFDRLPPCQPVEKRRPLAVISNTTKGKGVDFMENTFKWHGGGIAKEQLDQALASLEKNYIAARGENK